MGLMKKDTDSILTLVSSNTVSRNTISGHAIRQVLEKLPSIPILKRKTMMKLERRLGDPEIRHEFVSVFWRKSSFKILIWVLLVQTIYLQSHGGKENDDVMDRIMRCIFADEVACRYSFLGRRGKMRFLDLVNIWGTIKGKTEPMAILIFLLFPKT